MFERNIVSVIIALSLIFGMSSQSFAQDKETKLMEKKNPKKQAVEGGACACLKPGIDAIQKAYASLEEDEWPKAIGECKNTIASISALSKSCTCPEIAAYKAISDSFLKYAEGGNHLDSADDPDCPYALKTYSASIAGLKDSLEKITDKDVKTSVKNILEYAQEEELFVKDECADQKNP